MAVKKLIELTRMKKLKRILAKINELSAEMAGLSDEALSQKTDYFRECLAKGQSLDDILPEAFAAMREADKRILGMYPYDVQVLGGIILHQGNVAEMRTGEGKTLTATLPAYLNALTGKGVMVVTPNNYLAIRDGKEMRSVYEFMGLKVAIGVPENPKTKWKVAKKKEVYQSDIIYTTNGGLGFDYLLDNLATSHKERYMRDFHYAIIDEVDAVLLDSAQTPLIISGVPRVQSNLYELSDTFVQILDESSFEIDEEKKSVWLTDKGIREAEQFLDIPFLYKSCYLEHIRHLNLALRAQKVFTLGKNYILEEDEIKLLDAHSGRVLEGTKLQHGQQQALEMKEQVKLTKETRAMASITYQNLFRMFKKIAGMTGTGKTAEEEFIHVYNMEVVQVPTHEPIRRKDLPDVIFTTMPEKLEASLEVIIEKHRKGQPLLIFTATIAFSEIYSELLLQEGIAHNVLNAHNTAKEAAIIAEAGQVGAVTIATALAGRGTDIKLSEEAIALGGLAVIGVERMDSERVDLQIRGRSGRQGDVGSSQFFISLEDDLILNWGDDWLKTYYRKQRKYQEKYQKRRPLKLKRLDRAVKRCQTVSDDVAISLRGKSLELDGSMKRQRDIIYNQRDRILSKKTKQITNKELIRESIDVYFEGKKQISVSDWLRFIYDNVSYHLSIDPKQLSAFDTEQMIDKLATILEEELVFKKDSLSNEALFQEFYDKAYLKAIDECWVEQVDYLEQLKGVVFNRQIAQLNPIHEYHREAYQSFEKMKRNIHLKILKNLALSTIVRELDGTVKIQFV